MKRTTLDYYLQNEPKCGILDDFIYVLKCHW